VDPYPIRDGSGDASSKERDHEMECRWDPGGLSVVHVAIDVVIEQEKGREHQVM
jgi:hypothetical protein